MIGVKFQGAPETFRGLVQAIQGQERDTASVMRGDGTGELFHRDAAGGERLRRTPGITERLGQVPVNGRRPRIQRDYVVVERDLVSIYAGLFPGQLSENRENDEEDTRCPDLQKIRQLARAVGGGTDEQPR